jgi:hypothetical protein
VNTLTPRFTWPERVGAEANDIDTIRLDDVDRLSLSAFLHRATADRSAKDHSAMLTKEFIAIPTLDDYPLAGDFLVFNEM